MLNHSFRLKCILRCVLLFVSILLLFHLHYNSTLIYTKILLFVVIIFQVIDLIHFVERTNYIVSTFLQSIKYSEFRQSFEVADLGISFQGLKSAFNNVIEDFQKMRSETSEHYQYLQNVIQHIGIGLIAFRHDGKIEFMNKAAQKLFKVKDLAYIQKLSSINKDLPGMLFKMKSGEKILIKVMDKHRELQLSLNATEFKLSDRFITIVSFQNIGSELEEKELEAWQKLIRVMTHEIMNSITPISSLTSTVDTMLGGIATQCSDSEDSVCSQISDIQRAVKTIQKRSEGLTHFVQSYRNLTHIPEPKFSNVSIIELFNRVILLLQNEVNAAGISIARQCDPETLEITADDELIEQVLINLIKNSINALAGRRDGNINLSAFLSDNSIVQINVTDNGPGILPEIQEKIFIPFFTTRQKGSGIGLSLTRQIMKMHGGAIKVSSQPNEGTTFSLLF